MQRFSFFLIFTFALLFFTVLVVKEGVLQENTSNGKVFTVNSMKNIINQKEIVNKKESGKVTLLFGGNVMFGRMVTEKAIKEDDFSYPFNKISDFTKRSDIFFVNLESPFFERCPRHTGGLKFCAPFEMVHGLVSSGVNVVTLANNHTGNYGSEEISQTKKLLDENGIGYTGQNGLFVKKVNDITPGFLGFDLTGKSPVNEVYKIISESGKDVDFLIVGVHWGHEYKSTANSKQREWAREMVKNGADIIVGHHPHWVQDFECLNSEGTGTVTPQLCNGISGKPVYYSLGNLVFD